MESFFKFFSEKLSGTLTSTPLPQLIIGGIAMLIGFLAFFILLAKNNAIKISICFVVYTFFVSAFAVWTEISRVEYLLLIIGFVLCVVIMFSTEIKRAVWKTKVSKNVSTDVINTVKASQHSVNTYINDIIKALQNMSKNEIGAIIILSNAKIPNSILSSGVMINAEISSALIESIFFPKSPLHDGAIILQNDKILAAGCFLPLSQGSDLPKDLGTRHRAGIGVTEALNVTAIIVSEETGIISYARGGKITRYVDSEMLRNVLKEFYWQDLIGRDKGGKGGLL